MGINLQSCCHKCKVKVFHFRGKEDKTLLPFYKLHRSCISQDPKNIETLDDQAQEADRMSDGSYKDQWEYDSEKGSYKI